MNELSAGIEACDLSDFARAYGILLPLAVGGDPVAQCHIATMHHLGPGVPPDPVEAVKWYLAAAEQRRSEGNISGLAYHNLGTLYTTGMPGLPPDPALAKEYRRKAAELGAKLVPEEWLK